MPDEERRGVVQHVRRFFRLPRGTPRGPAPARPLVHVWLFGLAAGAAATAVGWGDDGTLVMMVWAELAILDDVIAGVRHRWPAFLGSLVAGTAVNRLARAALPDFHRPWVHYCVYAVMTLAALTTFVAVTRLPRRQNA
jgi:hypothetical protein